MRFSDVLGPITPEGLRNALRAVAAILYIVYNVLRLIDDLTRNRQE